MKVKGEAGDVDVQMTVKRDAKGENDDEDKDDDRGAVARGSGRMMVVVVRG